MRNDKRKSLNLLAHDPQDLAVASSLLQGAKVSEFDLVYLENEGALFDRFYWEGTVRWWKGERAHPVNDLTG